MKKKRKKRNLDTKPFITLPFSKSVVLYSRFECYIITAILLLFVWFDKDVSSLTELITVSWVGYNGLKGLYIWMAKNEHMYDKKISLIKITKSLEEATNIIDEISSEGE